MLLSFEMVRQKKTYNISHRFQMLCEVAMPSTQHRWVVRFSKYIESMVYLEKLLSGAILNVWLS